jgi:hypothetical protein
MGATRAAQFLAALNMTASPYFEAFGDTVVCSPVKINPHFDYQFC